MIPTNLIDQLKRDEGLRLYPYTDTVGKLTIGYGRNLTDVGITQDEADLMLQHNVADTQAALARALPVSIIQSIDPVRMDALTNMAFNMGVNALMKFNLTMLALMQKDYERAADAMLDSQWARQVGARAQRLAQQMRTGQYQ